MNPLKNMIPLQNFKYNQLLCLISILLTSQCAYTPFNKPEPSVVIEPLLGIAIAGERAIASLQFAYSSCDQADTLRLDEPIDFNYGNNTFKFFRFEGDEKIDFYRATLSTSRNDTCFVVGNENSELDTNSPNSAIEFPDADASCSSSYSFSLAASPNFRCLGLISFNAGSARISVTKIEPTGPITVSGINPNSSRWGEIVTLTGRGFSTDSSNFRNTIYFSPATGSSRFSSSPIQSEFSRALFQVPFRAGSGNLFAESFGSNSYGSLNVTTSSSDTTSYTHSSPACTYSPLSSGEGTDLAINSNLTFGVPLPFQFTYLDSSFEYIFLSLRGLSYFISERTSANLTEEGFSGSESRSHLTSSFSYPTILALWFGDTANRSNTNLKYATQGTSPNRVFIVEWRDLPSSDSFNFRHRLNFQLRLFESDNSIEFHYGNKTIQNASGGTGSTHIGIKSWPGIGNYTMNGVSGVTGTTVAPILNSEDHFPAPNTCYRFTRN